MPGNTDLERENVKYNFKRKRSLLGCITPGKCSSKNQERKKKKEWDGRGQNQHSTQKGKHKVSSITDQSTLIWSQVLGLDQEHTYQRSQPKAPCWSYWPHISTRARPRVPRASTLGLDCFYPKSWCQKLESSKLWNLELKHKLKDVVFYGKTNLLPVFLEFQLYAICVMIIQVVAWMPGALF